MSKRKNYKHLFFDLDGTVTRSRTPITKKMFKRLAGTKKDIIVITGARLEQMESQLGGLECFMMPQNGNHAVFAGEELWRDVLHPDKVLEIMDHINTLSASRTWDVPDETDLLEDRGCQISYSIYGHHAPVEDKEKFDPDQKKRKKLLEEHPLNSDTIEAKIAGTTCLDYMRKGRNKGYNVTRLIERMGWNKDECVYFGDALFPGGNDEAVIGVIDTVQVDNQEDTYNKLEGYV
jgi:HAD superfamily hydrolase (TIGR01484 family)